MASSKTDDVMSEHWLLVITRILEDMTHNTSIDLRKPHLRPVFEDNYWFFIFMYSLIIIFGTVANVAVVIHIVLKGLYQEPTFSFLINLSISDFFKCVVVLPITLAALLIQNWVFGQFLCFFLPMMQDIPVHVSTLTLLLIALDRYRFLQEPTGARLSAFVCATSTWFFAVCIALPYLFYITYIDLETYQPNFAGVGVCIFNLADDMQEYMRPLFLITYAAPMASIAYLYVKSSRVLQIHEEPLAVLMYERGRQSSSTSSATPLHEHHRSHQGRFMREQGAPLDVAQEQRGQRYLGAIAAVHALCLGPLMVLRLARLAVTETYENAAHFDVTYTLLVWLAFVPTCCTPLIYAAWQMTRRAKDRLRGYFRFSNRKSRGRFDPDADTEADAGSVVSYVHKASNASSCPIEQRPNS